MRVHGSVLQVALFSWRLGCHQLKDQASWLASDGAGSGLLNGWPGELMHNFLPPTNPSTHLVCLHCALGAGCPTSGLDVGSWASGVLHALLVDILGGAIICERCPACRRCFISF